MKNTRPGNGFPNSSSGAPGFVRRLLDSLGAMGGGGRLVPVPIPVSAEGPYLRRCDRDWDSSPQISRVFGRRKEEPQDPADEPAQNQSEDVVEAGDQDDLPAAFEPGQFDVPDPLAHSEFSEQIPPIPSAISDDEESSSELVTSSGGSPVESTWSSPVADSEAQEPSPFSYEAATDQPDLPAWTPSPISGSGFPSFISDAEPSLAPWSGGLAPDPVNFQPESAADSGVADPNSSWPREGEEPVPVWSATDGETEAEPTFTGAEVTEAETQPASTVDEFAPVAEATPEPAQPEDIEEAQPVEVQDGDVEPFEAEQITDVMAVSEASWSLAEPVPAMVAEYRHDEVSYHVGAAALVVDARAFPLPEGDVLFKNLRSGFTDPARLLRHLAGEGHTGVMHVASLDDRNSYIVLVDGYVVAVASDSQGKLTTTNRVSFPSFPNSQDILNVITYPREIARGLGLLLHAPVHFRGLGAMFVNLDGLRSYLSKHSASGGMVVQSDSGTGVALFDEGRLVGAYSGSAVPEADLSPLRELIKDLDAEIDVRFGGPQSLDPIPLDTLLAGYPL